LLTILVSRMQKHTRKQSTMRKAGEQTK
jgi:hypothetical protein